MQTKKWYQSKTIWGIAIAFIGFLITEKLQVPDVSLPTSPDFNQLQAYYEAIQDAQGNIGAILGQLVSAFGTLLAIIGRIKAETTITK